MTKSFSCKLRPHHVLCIHHFVGMGYSAEFVRYMTEIVGFLEKKNPSVMLIANCDMICEHCPNRQGIFCIDEDKVSAFDKAFLERCGLVFGDDLHWQTLKSLALDNIIRQNMLCDVCKDCMWQCRKKSLIL